jgi:hypothetical protein
MTGPPDPAPRTLAHAFGIDLELDDRLAAPGIARVAGHDGAPTVVTLADGLEELWGGASPARTREMRDAGRVLLSVDHDEERGYLLDAPGIGAALVAPDGMAVRCARTGAAEDWEAVLVGQVLPLAATLRGLEMFHAAGVEIAERSYLLCAQQGTGKTSLATHLVMSGAALLSDDVVAVDDGLVAHAGAVVLHVREAELERLEGRALPGLERIGSVRGRATFVPERTARSRPLGGILLLERAGEGAEIEPVSSPDPRSLLASTFNLSVRTPERLLRHLDLTSRMAAAVPMTRVRILPGRAAGELAEHLAAYIDDHPTARA